jgi:hypothetical protein
MGKFAYFRRQPCAAVSVRQVKIRPYGPTSIRRLATRVVDGGCLGTVVDAEFGQNGFHRFGLVRI